MRLPTVGQFKFQMNAMAQQFNQIQALQLQATNGKKIQRASDDPSLANRIRAVEEHLQQQKSFELNNALAESQTQLAFSHLQEGVNLVGQIQQLMQRARSDVTSEEDKKNIAEQLRGHLNSLLMIANAQDGNRDYIFSGLNTKTPAYQLGASGFEYQGSQEAFMIPIGGDQAITYHDSGYLVFGDIFLGNGTFSVSADVINNTGTGVISSGQALTNYIPDEYTITFIVNDSGKLAYKVTGQESGQVIPVPPDEAPVYQPGAVIQFNGVSLEVSGQPHAGDTFNVKPSSRQNVFNTLQAIIDTLESPVNTPKEKADFHQAMNEHASSMQQIFNHLQLRLNELGNRAKTIDDQKLFTENVVTEQKILLGKLSDADMAQVIADLSQKLAAIQVTQQSYLRIQETFFALLNRWNS
ncbi:flagellar hook-associated protein FlgL [Legionella nagasakiensis]|uniref:flagellar hook-associated protein FlgL n=1 Tax=Legionella nagasakiensis TaxID=535290 RepID=UPI001055D94E|nr:flagellar hook-associated protein FlgL [Legionella nagasakiensis]